MSIKLLTNNQQAWEALTDHLKDRLEKERQRLETQNEPADIYRLQGRIQNIKELLKLREKVNDDERRLASGQRSSV